MSENLSESVMINIDTKKNFIEIYTNHKKYIGKISGIEIIAYVIYPIYNKIFLDLQQNQPFVNLVDKYVCKSEIINNEVKITLLDYNNSILMGNVELLMFIYKIVDVSEKEELEIEFKHIKNSSIKNKIIRLINQLKYLLLNYILQLILKITSAIKDDLSKTDLKNKLFQYSVICTNKLNSLMKTKIEDNINEINLLKNDLNRIAKLKIELNNKIQILSNSVKDQYTQINYIKTTISDNQIKHDYTDKLIKIDLSQSNYSDTNDFSIQSGSSANSANSINSTNSANYTDTDFYFSESDVSDNNLNITYLTPSNV